MPKIYMSLPCTYDNETFKVSCLKLQAKAWPMEEAFFASIKNVPELYAELCTGVIKDDKLIIPFSQKVYDRIIELEPLPKETKKAVKETKGLLKASPEETIKFGY